MHSKLAADGRRDYYRGTMKVSGKRVLVTAGASGIGATVAQRFLQAGAHVHVCDIDERALQNFSAAHTEISASLCDVADEAAVDTLFEDLDARFGGLDVLVNNAGIAGPTGQIDTLQLSDWRRTLSVNVDSIFLCTRRALPMLKAADDASIVNMSSTAGFMGYPLRTPYASAKWAVIGLTKSLAMELGSLGIRVNAICPGPVAGERMDSVIAAEAQARGVATESVREGYAQTVSLSRFVDADEIADAILFLASPAARSISGQALAVDGHTETLVQR